MTSSATAAPVTGPSEALYQTNEGPLRKLSWAVIDSGTIMHQNLLRWARTPAYIVFTVIQPMMFMLLFRYVFGGAIHVSVKGGYVNYLMPGIIGQTCGFTSFSTAISLAQELQKGSIDRLRSMPMARSAVLVGRLGADLLRLALTIGVLIGTGYLVGFRFDNGVGPAVGMFVFALIIGLAVASVSAFTGLAIRDEESVQAFGLIWVFPLTFVSSAFVPIQTMPGWLQAFARNQPFTIFIDELRSLAVGGPLLSGAWQSLAWIVGIFAVFGWLSARAYRRV